MNKATESVEITSKGIRKVLNKYTPQRAIAEYIWNGFDANATVVRVVIECEEVFDSIVNVIVIDNGDGIVYELLPQNTHRTQNRGTGTCFTEKLSQ